jgi:hypothetical protein
MGVHTVRVAYFDCFSGISGDMTLGALIDAGVDVAAIRVAVESLGLPAQLNVQRVKKSGFAATQVTVEAAAEHKHRHLHHILQIVAAAQLSDRQRDLVHRVFRRLAEAEAAAHGSTIEKVHFHEVGAVDSIVDIVGSVVGLDLLGVDRFVSSAVPTGCGTVRGAHGTMPVPAPGTAALLKGVPLASSAIPFELTTPTGAAILTTVVSEFGPLPAMRIDAIGYGAGQRDLAEQPNLLRLFVGTVAAPAHGDSDSVVRLETNLDDVPGEFIGYTIERLFDAGALDVFTTAIGMKKNRPGTLLSVLCVESAAAALEEILFRETGTLGVRRSTWQRRKLPRVEHRVETPFGPVLGKRGTLPDGSALFAPEFEDCRRVARERGVALRDVYLAAIRGFDATP